MKSIYDVINTVVGKVPGCSEPEVVSAYRYALIDFCTRTRCMQSWVTTNTDDLITPSLTFDQQVIDILDALLNDEEIHCVGVNDRAVVGATEDEPVLTWTNPNVPQVVPQPGRRLPMQLLLVFAPGPTATEIEDTVWMSHSEAIERGALSRLLIEPDRPYTNPTLAGIYATQFEQAIARAATKYGARTVTRAHRKRVRHAPF